MCDVKNLDWKSYSSDHAGISLYFKGTTPSGRLQYLDDSCNLETFLHTSDGSTHLISKNTNIPDEELKGGVGYSINLIHTYLLHPYIYLMNAYLFKNFSEMQEITEWNQHINFFDIMNEATVQGFQVTLFAQYNKLTINNIIFNSFGQYGFPAKSKCKTVLEYLCFEFIYRLGRFTNQLTKLQKQQVIRAFILGWNIGIEIQENEYALKTRRYFDNTRDYIEEIYELNPTDNGYEFNLYPDKREYQINLCLPANQINEAMETIGSDTIKGCIVNANVESTRIFNLIMDILITANNGARLGYTKLSLGK